MSESTLIPLIVGALAGAALTIAVLVIRHLARGSRELGTDVEHATHRTLHLASQAASHLRAGLGADDASRAARHLRSLLGCEILAIVSADGRVSVDGPADAFGDVVRDAAARARDGSRTVVVDVRAAPGRDRRHAIAAPIVTSGRVVGAVVAVAETRHAPLVRATGEVAEWVAAQLSLGELDASRTALAEAELRELRAQISPHFIYNALNAIASFITTDPATARELVLEFADFTRYSFRRHGDFTTLAEELRSIHSYLRLERARFGDRLDVTLQIAPETLATVIPFLSLQPLVENSVRHGLEAKESGGRITIVAEESGTHVAITVEDDGAGTDPDDLADLLASREPGDHIGLRNVDTRLRQVYGDEYGLVVETAVGAGTLVRMRVPRSLPEHETAA